ncbi:hypothetical protein, partial [Thalassospira profundimaris]|uniref:hypothetical protein n=1 Tax=Thalassospira profundimaris TaxID=502049 RepID=UPI0015F04174
HLLYQLSYAGSVFGAPSEARGRGIIKRGNGRKTFFDKKARKIQIWQILPSFKALSNAQSEFGTRLLSCWSRCFILAYSKMARAVCGQDDLGVIRDSFIDQMANG